MLVLLLAAAVAAPSIRDEAATQRPILRTTRRPAVSLGGSEKAVRTALDAERAFAADAQVLGQWTAFRKWAATDATLFLPQPTNAQAALKDWRNPARSVAWTPTASYLSCDGTVAANTGEWRQPDGTVGFFTTIWVKQPDGSWRWVVDGGDRLTAARPQVASPPVQRAACAALAPSVRPAPDPRQANGYGHSPDWTLTWEWSVGADGARTFEVSQYDGRYRTVIRDAIAAPQRARP